MAMNDGDRECYINFIHFYNFLFFSLFLSVIFYTSCQLDILFNSIFFSQRIRDSRNSNLMLPMLLSLMFRPIGMSRQDSVQQLLGHRFSPSLLRGDSCCVNQCFPFILNKNENAFNVAPTINSSINIDILDVNENENAYTQ